MTSDERIRELAEIAAQWLHKGAPLDEATSTISDAIRIALAEHAEEMALIADDYHHIYLGESLEALDAADHIAAAIRAQGKRWTI